jgi:gas vesicle protein
MSREDNGNSLVAFLLGAAAGAAAGVLLAPKSGKETREQIGDWLKERREQGAEFLSKVKEESHAKKEQLSTAYKAGKQAYFESGNHKEKDAVNA